jgi:hypothetical protein
MCDNKSDTWLSITWIDNSATCRHFEEVINLCTVSLHYKDEVGPSSLLGMSWPPHSLTTQQLLPPTQLLRPHTWPAASSCYHNSRLNLLVPSSFLRIYLFNFWLSDGWKGGGEPARGSRYTDTGQTGRQLIQPGSSSRGANAGINIIAGGYISAKERDNLLVCKTFALWKVFFYSLDYISHFND